MTNKVNATLMLFMTALVGGCGRVTKHEVWLIPQGYKGWLRLDYSVQNAPPLPMENGSYIIRMPSSGRLQTSSGNNPSIDRNDYYSLGPNGRELLTFTRKTSHYAIQNAYASGSLDITPDRTVAWWRKPQIGFECVFVGADSELKADGRNCSAWEWGELEPPKLPNRLRHPR